MSAGVSAGIGMEAGARVSPGVGVAPEQAISAVRMTRKGIIRSFSTWNPSVPGTWCYSGLIISLTPVLSA